MDKCPTCGRDRQVAERFHPSEFILDEIKARGWSKDTFLKLLNCQDCLTKNIFNEKGKITVTVACELSRVFGSDVQTWLNIQRAYDEWEV